MRCKVYRKYVNHEQIVKVLPLPGYTDENKELYFAHIRSQKENGWRQVILSDWLMNKIVIKLMWDSWKFDSCKPSDDNPESAKVYFDLVSSGFPFIPEYMELIEGCSMDVVSLTKDEMFLTLRANGVIETNTNDLSFFKDIETIVKELVL